MKYIIIGNSAAGVGAVEGIRQIDSDGEIAVISNEPHHTYSRPLISYYLLGKVNEEQMKYRGEDFYTKNNVNLILNTAVTEIDPLAKTVTLDSGEKMAYDKLLAGVGSTPFIPPFDGLDTVKDKYTFMSFDDAKKIGGVTNRDKKVLIIGAGLIGLKCAEGIYNRASRITVADMSSHVLSSILDDESAGIVERRLSEKGIELKLSCTVKCFLGNKAMLDGGGEIEFDVLIIAAGIRPNVSLLRDIADIDKGIIINGKCETSCPDIYAAGDCTQSEDTSSGQSKIMALLPNAYMQGECAGINMAGGAKTFNKAVPMNSIGLFGIHIMTAGNYNGDVYLESCGNRYKKLFYSEKLNGYIFIDDKTTQAAFSYEKAGIYTNLIKEQTPLTAVDFDLICKKPGLMAFSREERNIKLGGVV